MATAPTLASLQAQITAIQTTMTSQLASLAANVTAFAAPAGGTGATGGTGTTGPGTPTPTLSPVPFGVHPGTWLGGGGGTEGSIAKHMADVKSQITTPKIVAAVLINSYQDSPGPPSNWVFGDAGNWTAANGLAMDGSMVPLLFMRLTDGSTTDTDYAGWSSGKYDTPFQNALSAWLKVAPFPTIYIRVNPEFNTNFLGGGVPTQAQVSLWIAALKHLCNVAHTWGNNNKCNVEMVWCPDTSYTSAEPSTFSLPVASFFPSPDANAVNRKYINVIGSDAYMKGYGVSGVTGLSAGLTTPLATNNNWSLGTFIQLAQANGCNLGISETGDGPGCDNNNSATDGVMAGFATFLNQCASLTPPVPVAYVAVFDITSGVAKQCTGGGAPQVAAGWKCCFTAGAPQPGGAHIPQLMTVPPI